MAGTHGDESLLIKLDQSSIVMFQMFRMFRIFDDDGNKALNVDEFVTGMRDYGTKLSDTQLKSLFSQFDKDGSGAISFDELLKAIRVRRQTRLLCFFTARTNSSALYQLKYDFFGTALKNHILDALFFSHQCQNRAST